MRTLLLVFLLGGCAMDAIQRAPDPNGPCLQWTMRKVGRGAVKELWKNGAKVEWPAAVADQPEARALAQRVERERKAGLGFVLAAPALVVSALLVAAAGIDGSRHLQPWAEEAAGTLIGAELLSIATGVSLAFSAGHHEREALVRDNQRCGQSRSM